MRLEFAGEIWYWRGPAPWYFVTVPEPARSTLHTWSHVTYGWGMIPVSVSIGDTDWTTSLWPKDGGYIVPIKKALQDREGIGIDDTVEVTLDIDA
jgi:hypothetical protein